MLAATVYLELLYMHASDCTLSSTCNFCGLVSVPCSSKVHSLICPPLCVSWAPPEAVLHVLKRMPKALPESSSGVTHPVREPVSARVSESVSQ